MLSGSAHAHAGIPPPALAPLQRNPASQGQPALTAEAIKEDRNLQLPAGTPIGRVTVAITPADETAPTGRRLLAKLLVLQASIPMAEGPSQELIDAALERERASWR